MMKNIDKVIKENKYLTEENIQLNKELNSLVVENDILRSQNRKLMIKISELENKQLDERYLYSDIMITKIMERILK